MSYELEPFRIRVVIIEPGVIRTNIINSSSRVQTTKLKNLEFNNKNMQMKFDMPFNWNLSRINKTSIFVHEELYVPKPNAFTEKGSYAGTVNGIDISKSIILDNSNPNKDLIHIMLP